jgi:FkbM family methyltransferase
MTPLGRRIGSALRYAARLGKTPHGKVSYAQAGEDLIASFVLRDILRRPKGTYFDIGANDPIWLSNTYLFYRSGWRGVCIEPNAMLAKRIRRTRPRDLCVEAAVGIEGHGTADLYVMEPAGLSTFVKEDAERIQSEGGGSIQQVCNVSLIPVNDLIAKHFTQAPDFVSLDIEGLDLAVLQSWDFRKCRPAVICVETLEYSATGVCRKLPEIAEYMCRQDYFAYADTFINTIFVDQGAWASR